MFKKFLSAIITIGYHIEKVETFVYKVLALSCSTIAFAAEEKTEVINIPSNSELVSTITSPSALEDIVINEKLSVPEQEIWWKEMLG